jgi:outer membrane lipoprotein-sorting protein
MRAVFVIPLIAALPVAMPYQPDPGEIDQKAKAILDKVKVKYEAYQTMTIEFEQRIIPSEGDAQVTEGDLTVKGDKFRLEYDDQWIVTNLQSYWIVLLDEDKKPYDATVSDYDEDADGVIKPSDIFKLYEKDFKYSMNDQPVGRKKLADGSVELYDIIRFAPLDHDVFYHTIKLYVSQKDQSIERAVVIDKEQNQLVFKITSLVPNLPVSDSQFTFDPSKYPGVIVNDTRR